VDGAAIANFPQALPLFLRQVALQGEVGQNHRLPIHGLRLDLELTRSTDQPLRSAYI
jgi:hypothetical protein